MTRYQLKVIGYFAYSHSGHVFCDGNACIIVDSEEMMRQYLNRIQSEDPYQKHDIIKKTTFGEILEGLRMSGVYALDEKCYQRFSHYYQPGEQAGELSVSQSYDIIDNHHFYIIQLHP